MTEKRNDEDILRDFKQRLEANPEAWLHTYGEALYTIHEARKMIVTGLGGIMGGLLMDRGVVRFVHHDRLRKLGRVGSLGIVAGSTLLAMTGLDTELFVRKAIKVMREVKVKK